jgi:hypothetical protein
MNKIIKLYVQGTDYNPLFKWNSVEEFIEAVNTNTRVPKPNDIIVEAYIDDNLVDIGNTFEVTLEKLKLFLF